MWVDKDLIHSKNLYNAEFTPFKRGLTNVGVEENSIENPGHQSPLFGVPGVGVFALNPADVGLEHLPDLFDVIFEGGRTAH